MGAMRGLWLCARRGTFRIHSKERVVSDYNPGDRVRVTRIWEGVVDQYGDLRYGYDNSNRIAIGAFVGKDDSHIEIIERALPPEPPVSSVVVDGKDVVFKRLSNSELRPGRNWLCLDASIFVSWESLNRHNGPIAILREGGQS